MRYMLLIYGCNREELGAYDRVNLYVKELQSRGVFVAADPLQMSGATVRVRSDETLVTDGPFAETHEQLGGYFIVDCADLDAAVSLAALCPLAEVGSVEVRPILAMR
jgi:hypothetical protein